MVTTYPGAVDSLPRPTSATQMDATGFEGDVVVDNLSDAVEAIEAELGTDPAGSFATVKARLDSADAADPSGWTFAPASGRWTPPAPHVGSRDILVTTAGRAYGTPVLLAAGTSVSDVALEVTTTGTGNNWVLVYGSASGVPSGACKQVLGSMDFSSTGIKVLTGLSWTVAAGDWLVVAFSTAGRTYEAEAFLPEHVDTGGYTDGLRTLGGAWASSGFGEPASPTLPGSWPSASGFMSGRAPLLMVKAA